MRKKWSKTLSIFFILCLLVTSFDPKGAFAEIEDTENVLSEETRQLLQEMNEESLGTTSEFVFDNYPEILDIPIDEEAPDPDEQPQFTEEEILQMEWDQLTAHAVSKINELYDRRTLQIASYFYTNLNKLLSINEINEVLDWDIEEVMQEIEQLHVDQDQVHICV